MEYDCISHPTPWPQEHSVLVRGFSCLRSTNRCAGCTPWDSPAPGPGVHTSCATRAGSSHSQGKSTLHHLEQHSQTQCCFKSRGALMLLICGGAGGRHQPCPCHSLLTANPWGDIPGGNFIPGELALPLQRAAPMTKAEACLNPAHFLLKYCVCTYICIICVYIYINYRQDRAVFQTSNMSTYCTNRKQHCSNRSLKRLNTNQEPGQSSKKYRKKKIRPFLS